MACSARTPWGIVRKHNGSSEFRQLEGGEIGDRGRARNRIVCLWPVAWLDSPMLRLGFRQNYVDIS